MGEGEMRIWLKNGGKEEGGMEEGGAD